MMAMLGRQVDGIRAEANELLPVAVALRIEFEAVIEDAPQLCGESLIEDMRKSLLRLREDLEGLMELGGDGAYGN